MFRWLAQRRKKSTHAQRVIVSAQADELGLQLGCSNGTTMELLWREIVSVRGYKRDLSTTDSIVIEFERADGTVIRSWEEDPVYREVIAAAEQNLADFPSYNSWYAVVAYPPFETRLHTLWGLPTAEAPGLPRSLCD